MALAVGLFLVHWVMKLFERYEAKMKLEPTLRGFIKNLIRILLYVIVIMTAANTAKPAVAYFEAVTLKQA